MTATVWGPVLAGVAVSLPSFVLVLIISAFFARFRRNTYVDAAFTMVRPTSVGLIAAAALLLTSGPDLLAAPFTPVSPSLDQVVVRDNFTDLWSILLFLLSFLVTVKKWLHPILTILLAGLAGLLIYGF